MEKYCAMSGSKWMIFGFMAIVVALKIMSFYWDTWQLPELSRYLTARNIFYYLFWFVLANLAFWPSALATIDRWRYMRPQR